MPEFIIGARGHDFGRQTPEALFSAIGQAGFRCTQLAFTKAIEGVKSYADVTSSLVEAARAASKASNVGIAVDGTYVELSYADEDKRKAEVTKVLSQIPVAKALGAGCMGSETTNMAKQPGISRKEAQEALLRSLGEILPRHEHPGGRQDGAGHDGKPQPAGHLRFCQLCRPGECFRGRPAPPVGQSGQLVWR